MAPRLISQSESPAWLFDLQKALVEAGAANWAGGWKPHPQDVTDVVIRFLIDNGTLSADQDAA